MNTLLNSPLLILVCSFFLMLLSAGIGVRLRKPRARVGHDPAHELDLIIAAVLTLLGLTIGFTFSMATNRYDLRKSDEEAEANAIGTEYVRADFLSPTEASKLRVLLAEYLDERILFYESRDERQLQQIAARTVQLQSELWITVQVPASARQTPVLTLVVSGMNDVLNSQGYTQSAWLNRIPVGAWLLMGVVAIFSNLLVGYNTSQIDKQIVRLLALPLVISIAFLLVADIDSPRRGLILVRPQNLVSLAQSMHHD